MLTSGILRIDALAQAQKIAHELPGAVILDRFRNPANPETHGRTTAMEIWRDTQGEVDFFVSGIGTVENGQILEIGVGFVLAVLNSSILAEVIAGTKEYAFSCARRLACEEGLVAGVSSGAAVHAALPKAARQAAFGEIFGDSSRHRRKAYRHELAFRGSGAASAMNSHGRIRRN